MATVLVLVALTLATSVQPEQLRIGAILDRDAVTKEKAFRWAVSKLNTRRYEELEAVVEVVEVDDPFRALEAACRLLEMGVVAILGPSSDQNANVVQSVCDDKDVPLLEVRWLESELMETINVHPSRLSLGRMVKEVLDSWDYKNFVLFYDDDDGLRRIGDLLEFYDIKEHNIAVRQLDRYKSGNYRPALKEVWRSGANRFVLDCSIDILEEVLRQAQQVGIMTSKEYFLITNLDFHTLNLTPFQYSDTNITGMRFFNPDDELIKDLALKVYENEITNIHFGVIAAWKLQLETALIVDAVMMFGETLTKLPEVTPMSIQCKSKDTWMFGSTLTNLVKARGYQGLTGYIQFDGKGYRSDFGAEIVELKEGGITRVGNWSSTEGLNISREYSSTTPPEENSLINRTFVIITCLTEPYGMRKESSLPLYGNDRYEGYGIDLIHELAQRLGFNYTFIIREDKKNGEYDEITGRWTGMIGDVIDGKADLAITDLTITSERETAVDFTTTFMSLGISILYQKPKKAPPSFFSFADPFALGVWKLLAAAFFGVSLALFVLGRISPSEWQNPYPCIDEPTFLVNQLSLRNCFWFMTGSLMQQGSEIAPVAVSTRMLAGMWWFFTLIMVSSYTANLAAFLATESPDNPFNDVFELVKVAEKKGIKYGAKVNGSTANFFRDSKQIEAFQEIYEYMKENEDEVMVKDNKLGVLKAEQENYAFFMEITSIEYEVQRRCSLTSVGGLLDEKGYGIAMRKNSSYRGLLSSTILKLQEEGILADLKRKWWQERRGGGQCPDEAQNAAATPLNLKNVGGVFWVTIMSSLLSCLMVFVEMCLHILKRSLRTKMSFKKLLAEELRFYFRKSKMVKPVTYSHSRRTSNTISESPKVMFTGVERPYGFISKPHLTDIQ